MTHITHPSHHVTRVLATVSDASAAARSRLAASWRRSIDRHGLDPARRDAVQRVEQTQLCERRQRAELVMRLAGPRLDALYQLVGSSGCGVLLTDAEGVVLDLRSSEADRAIFDSWGLTPGADWS